ncbi:hypothetical protein ACH5RR_033643, partial [Cinchona calisaya]
DGRGKRDGGGKEDKNVKGMVVAERKGRREEGEGDSVEEGEEKGVKRRKRWWQWWQKKREGITT